MSSIVKTITPFINREILCEALSLIGCKYTVQGNLILTDRKDFYGQQKFELTNGRYAFSYQSDVDTPTWRHLNSNNYLSVTEFLHKVEESYNGIYEKRQEELKRKHQEEERLRLEKERQAYVQKQKQTVIQNAKAKGYRVREEQLEGKVKLVLVRITY